MRAWSLVASLAVNAYLLGAMVLFATVVYPGFGTLERAAFVAAYRGFNTNISLAVVPFEFLAFLLPLLLYGVRPDSVPVWAVHGLTALGVAYFAITFGWHLPAHRPLAAGDNAATLLSPLLASQWARTGVQLVRSALLAWLTARAAGA